MDDTSRYIDVRIWKDLKISTLSNIKDLIKSAKILLEVNMEENKEVLSWHPWVSGGLYTFALEEFGKLLILLSCKPINGKVKIDYEDLFKYHREKFKRALAELPSECRLLHSGGYTASGYASSSFDTDTIADFEARKGIFYTDLGEKNNLKITPSVDAETMEKAISSFKTEIKKISL